MTFIGLTSFFGKSGNKIKTNLCSIFEHYKVIGTQLLLCEELKMEHGIGENRLAEEFRVGVSYVSAEILESYLDDLLEIKSKDEGLFIKRNDVSYFKDKFAVPLSFALITSLVGFSLNLTFPAHIASTVLIFAMAFFTFWVLSPYNTFKRRLYFAQLLSQEISRRRGRDSQGRQWSQSTNVISKIFESPDIGQIKGAARGIFH